MFSNTLHQIFSLKDVNSKILVKELRSNTLARESRKELKNTKRHVLLSFEHNQHECDINAFIIWFRPRRNLSIFNLLDFHNFLVENSTIHFQS